MEATVLSVGATVLDAALSYAKSAVAEEVALQLHIQRDHAFVRDELEMMRSFLMAAHEEEDSSRVFKTWVKQVRDVAYDVEDCLQDFSLHLDKASSLSLPGKLRQRRRIARKMKELRLRVEDVSHRNRRYQLFRDSSAYYGSSCNNTAQQSSVTAAAIFGVDEARRLAKQDRRSRADLVQLIGNEEECDLGVIAVWGTGGDLGQASIIRAAYENVEVKRRFPCRAWVRVMDPFNPKEFVRSLVKQFKSGVGVEALLEVETTEEEAVEDQLHLFNPKDLIRILFKQFRSGIGVADIQSSEETADKTDKELAAEFGRFVNDNSYLIVLTNLSTIEEWDQVKICFPNNGKGSRIIVSTTQIEVASLCAGQEIQVSELSQLSNDQTLYAFYEKKLFPSAQGSQDETSANNSTLPTSETSGNQAEGVDANNSARKSHLIGREKEKSEIIELLLNQSGQELPVISVWGMGGLGKTTLVKDLSGMFEIHACVTVMRPFILEELLRRLAMQLHAESSERSQRTGTIHFGTDSTIRSLAMMGVEELINKLARLLDGRRCLIILDDLSSTAAWDSIIQNFPRIENTSRIIVTTREENIARHCSSRQENVYKLKVLQYKDALELFTRKVFKDQTTNLDNHPELVDEAKLILKKCNGLPLALVTIGGFLANQPKTVVEWRKLNKHISAELEMNPELEAITSILRKSYDGLPYHLKSCFLYLSIFPGDHKVSRRRLVRRWTAENYSRGIRDKSAEEIANNYLEELIDRSMMLPSQQSVYSRKEIDSCHVHDLMREIGISKSLEENLVFRLEEGCSSNAGIFRHLAISRDWKGDKSEFESTVDLSCVRSLTVFGMVKPFFISEKMKFLRVLDLEHTKGLVDHHFQQIVELYHLKYLSLRGCGDIHYLPDSLGNLRQLQTLDIAFTNVRKLPKTITRLAKLQHLCAGTVGIDEDLPKLGANQLCLLTLCSLAWCVACCAPRLLKRRLDIDGETNRHDVCTVCCCSVIPLVVTRESIRGIQVPKGIRKLKGLQAMGLVNLARGKKILHDIKRLTRLRKLSVTGISRRNARELCSAITNLSCLESLLLRAEGHIGLLGCIDGISSPPENLQSLKLYGTLGELPPWIGRLRNLVKLSLRSTRILDRNASATVDVLGRLPNLTILRLKIESFIGDDLHFTFHGDQTFPCLMVMEFDRPLGLQSVRFQDGVMPKLELLDFCAWYQETRVGLLRGLPCLTRLREFTLSGSDYDDDFMEDLRAQLARNPNRPDFKRVVRRVAPGASQSVDQS